MRVLVLARHPQRDNRNAEAGLFAAFTDDRVLRWFVVAALAPGKLVVLPEHLIGSACAHDDGVLAPNQTDRDIGDDFHCINQRSGYDARPISPRRGEPLITMWRHRKTTIYLVGLFTVSLGLRLSAAAVLDAPAHGIDTAHHEHASIARNLATGNGFRFNFFGPLDKPVLTSIEAPLVPGLLAGCYWLFGVETREAFLAMIAIQSLIASITVVHLTLLAHDITGRPWHSGCVGAVAAVYPPLVVSPLHIQALVWNMFWISLLLVSAAAYRNRRTLYGSAGLVVAGVAGSLTDPIFAGEFLAVTLFLLVDAFLRSPETSEHLGHVVAARKSPRPILAVVALVICGMCPWTIRNYQVHGRFVPIKDSFYYVLWQGNHAASFGTDKFPVFGDAAAAIADHATAPAAYRHALDVRRGATSVNCSLSPAWIAELQALPNEIERMDRFRALAEAEVIAAPGRYLQQCLRRAYYWIWFDPTNPRSFAPVYRIGYFVLLATALVGVYSLRNRRRACGPAICVALAMTLVHVFIITSARFRIPLEMLLLIPSGVCMGAILQQMRQFGKLNLMQAIVCQSTKSALPILPNYSE